MLWPLVGSTAWKCGNIGEGSEKTMKNKNTVKTRPERQNSRDLFLLNFLKAQGWLMLWLDIIVKIFLGRRYRASAANTGNWVLKKKKKKLVMSTF